MVHVAIEIDQSRCIRTDFGSAYLYPFQISIMLFVGYSKWLDKLEKNMIY